MRWSKKDLSKEKKILWKDTVRTSETIVGRCSVKKVSLKISHYLHIIKTDIKGSACDLWAFDGFQTKPLWKLETFQMLLLLKETRNSSKIRPLDFEKKR